MGGFVLNNADRKYAIFTEGKGTWKDIICLAINILASEKTKVIAPEYYHPEWKNKTCCGEDKLYVFEED